MIDFILDFWPLVVAVVSVVIWLIRLEARAMANTREIKNLWRQRDEDLQASRDARDATNKKLDDIGSDLRDFARVITADIKHLLERDR